MNLKNKHIIIVPCYNEANRLTLDVFQDFLAEHDQAVFLFVNDGSHDGTQGMLDDFRQQHPERVLTLHLNPNQGKAEAVRRGFIEAFNHDAACISFIDADLATPLYCLPGMVAALEQHECDMVMASRVLMLGHRIERKRARHYIGRVFATAAAITLNLPVYDTQCGAKVFRTTPQLKEVMNQSFLSKWLFDIEILARMKLIQPEAFAAPAQRVVREYPLPEWKDQSGSKLTLLDGFKAIGELVRLFFIIRK